MQVNNVTASYIVYKISYIMFNNKEIHTKTHNSIVSNSMVQISLFNDLDHPQASSFYIEWRQVKMESGVSRREGERKREAD
jgi:hypothetical protein